MRIFVTGVAGFIGSHTAEKLLAQGHIVHGIDNFDPFYPRPFKEYNLRSILGVANFTFAEGSILDKDFLREQLTAFKADVVIHLAAKAGVRPSIDHIEDYYATNITGTVQLLELMKELGVSRMLFASSSSVYGNNPKVPFNEDDFVDHPISPYASTKKSGELLCHVYSHLYHFDITCLRFFTVFGPRQRPDLAIHKFTRLMDLDLEIPFYGDGTTSRDYTFVEDIAEGICCALYHLKGYKIYNLGESRVVSLSQLIAELEVCMKKKARLNHLPPQSGDVNRTFADIAKARAEIGYNPQYSLRQGLTAFVDWYNIAKESLYEKL